jgi:hypothetical protein
LRFAPSHERTVGQILTFGKQTFTVTEDHLKLLPHLNIKSGSWDYGAPGTDAKRPFGNSDVLGDMYEILTGAEDHYVEDSGEDLITDELAKQYVRLYEEMGTVLLICAQNNGVELGEYISAKYFNEWTKDG